MVAHNARHYLKCDFQFTLAIDRKQSAVQAAEPEEGHFFENSATVRKTLVLSRAQRYNCQMLDRHLLVLFLAAATLLAVTPGPGIFYVLARTLSGGKREGVLSSFGTFIGGVYTSWPPGSACLPCWLHQLQPFPLSSMPEHFTLSGWDSG